MNAKDYYYSEVAPEERGLNYQQCHQEYLYEGRTDENGRRIFNHVPQRSNDILIEGYISNLAAVSPEPIKRRLRSVFVAKRLNFIPNASALFREEKYSGDLIMFYVGLSDVCFQYAILFVEFVELMRARASLDDDSPEVQKLFIGLCRDITKITEAQIYWGQRNEIRFKDETVLTPSETAEDKAAAVACLMDKFVLYHEISHHFLGHTGKESAASRYLKEKVWRFLNSGSYAEEHRKELEADICALHLPLPAKSAPEDQFKTIVVETSLGALLTQSVLAQFNLDIHAESTSHPSWATRYSVCLEVLRSLYGSDILESIIDDVTRFQVLLFLVQDKGLGALNKKLMEEFLSSEGPGIPT